MCRSSVQNPGAELVLQVFVHDVYGLELITAEDKGKILIAEAAYRGFEHEEHILILLISLEHWYLEHKARERPNCSSLGHQRRPDKTEDPHTKPLLEAQKNTTQFIFIAIIGMKST